MKTFVIIKTDKYPGTSIYAQVELDAKVSKTINSYIYKSKVEGKTPILFNDNAELMLLQLASDIDNGVEKKEVKEKRTLNVLKGFQTEKQKT